MQKITLEAKKIIEENGMIFSGDGYIETPIVFLERLLLNHDILIDGYLAFVCIHDIFQGISSDYSDDKRMNNYIDEIRPGMIATIDQIRKDIENFKLEIEAEKTAPSDVPMGIRLHKRLGHL